jgi:hypothetical protein
MWVQCQGKQATGLYCLDTQLGMFLSSFADDKLLTQIYKYTASIVRMARSTPYAAESYSDAKVSSAKASL